MMRKRTIGHRYGPRTSLFILYQYQCQSLFFSHCQSLYALRAFIALPHSLYLSLSFFFFSGQLNAPGGGVTDPCGSRTCDSTLRTVAEAQR